MSQHPSTANQTRMTQQPVNLDTRTTWSVRMLLFVTSLALMLVVLFGGCDVDDDDKKAPSPRYEKMQKEVSEAADAIGEYSAEKKDEIVQNLRERMANLDERTADLQEKTAELTGKAKKEAQKKLETLREKRNELDKELEQMKDAGKENWTQFRKGLQNAWAEFREAYDDAEDELENAPEGTEAN